MAKKTNTVFVCENCGESTINWMGKCPSCGSWNSLKPFTEPEESKIKTVKNALSIVPSRINYLDHLLLLFIAVLILFLIVVDQFD